MKSGLFAVFFECHTGGVSSHKRRWYGAAETYGVVDREAPFEIAPMTLSLFRSAVGGDESGVRWFLGQIEAVCRRLSG